MNESGINPINLKREEIAVPYNSSTVECDLNICLSELGFSNPAGSLYSSVHDLAKLISFLFKSNQNPVNGASIN
jgi:hypothetical protein